MSLTPERRDGSYIIRTRDDGNTLVKDYARRLSIKIMFKSLSDLSETSYKTKL